MVRHLLCVTVATLLIVVCMLLPFLPGSYDGLAIGLSVMLYLFGFAGLVLVPIGLLWLVFELRRRRNASAVVSSRDWGHRFGVLSLCAATLVALFVAAAGAVTVGPTLGLAAIALWIYVAVRLSRRLAIRRSADLQAFNPAPVYLIILPIVAAIVNLAVVDRVADVSRNRAIDNSAPLIADIERYREANGQYPRSLMALHQDYDTGVIGVRQYHYEPQGEAYNLFFEHWSGTLATRELVMYNKLDEQQIASHDSDRLLWTPEQLATRRGYNDVVDARRPHWKRFWFD